MAVVCAVGLAAETYALAFLPSARAAANGTHTTLLKEFGSGAPITQAFTMQADGLHAFDFQIWTSARADVTLLCRVSAIEAGQATELYRWPVSIGSLSGQHRQTIEFPVIPLSTDHVFAVTLQVADVRPQVGSSRPDVALVASRDRPLPLSYLLVDGKERWGDLVFDTRAVGDTVLGRFQIKTLPSVPPSFRHTWYLVAILLLYNAMLVAFALRVLKDDPAQMSEVGAPDAPAPPDHLWRYVRGATVALILVGAIGATVWSARSSHGRVDLIDDFYQADLRSTLALHDAFDLRSVEIGIETRRAIFAHATSRITWSIVPQVGARLETAIALDPAVWAQHGNGVVFYIRVLADGHAIDLLARRVDPFAQPADRRWIPVDVDLTPYAGRTIGLVFETDASPPGQAPDASYDWALWGAPRIVVGGS